MRVHRRGQPCSFHPSGTGGSKSSKTTLSHHWSSITAAVRSNPGSRIHSQLSHHQSRCTTRQYHLRAGPCVPERKNHRSPHIPSRTDTGALSTPGGNCQIPLQYYPLCRFLLRPMTPIHSRHFTESRVPTGSART